MRSFIALAAVTTLALAGCASTPAADDDSISIVATTDVYGSLASFVAGDLADVTSIIDSAAQDPHSFEASATDSLAVSKADIVIENGGGYDPFIDTVLDATGAAPIVLSASELSGLAPEDDHSGDDPAGEDDHAEGEDHGHTEGFNEHVWYDFVSMQRLVSALGEALAEVDAANADTYANNAEELNGQLQALADRAAALGGDGRGVAITEPVPLYLLDSAGLENVTPEAFSEAIEEGTDVSPAILRDTLDVLVPGSVALLAYNEQTASPETEKVREAADAAGIPVVSFSETLPEGQDYLSWMTANLDALEQALSQ